MSASDTPAHLLTPEETAATIQSMRLHMAWSQEALASFAGLTVLTVQHMETGQPSSSVDRRAVAGAFGWQMSFFDEPQVVPTNEEMKIQKRLFYLEHVFLDATLIDSRGIVAWLMGTKGHTAMMPCSLAELPMVAQDAFGALAKYVHDHLDMICDGHRTKAQQHVNALTALEKPLLDAKHQLHAAVRQTMVNNPTWSDLTPIPLSVLYIIATPDKHALTQVAVNRQMRM